MKIKELFNKKDFFGEFSKNVLVLMTGTTIAQAIPIAISPILTRIYTPEQFGIFALYLSISSFFAAASTGRYELAIMLPKNDEDAANVGVLAMIIALCISIFTLILIIIFNHQIASLLNNEDVSTWLYFIPVAVFLTGVYQSFNYWNNRKKRYKLIANSKMLQSSAVASFNLGGGVGGFGVFGLIGGRLLGQTVSATYLARKTWLENRISKKEIKKSKIITLAKKYKNFTYFNLPNTLVDQVRTNGINILLNGIFSANILGFYFIALNIIQMPSSIMGASISQVFYQKISKIDDINIMRQLVKKFMAKAFLLAIVPFSLIFLLSEEVFGFVFGSEWSVAGKFAEILAPWVLINFITSPLSSVFVKLNKMNLQLYFAIVYCLVPISVILIGSYLKLDIYTVLSIMSFSMVILLLLYIKLMLSALRKAIL